MAKSKTHPKLKTHKGTAKRVSVTPTGKVMRQKANGTHFLQKKSASRKRVLVKKAKIIGAIARRIKRGLGV